MVKEEIHEYQAPPLEEAEIAQKAGMSAREAGVLAQGTTDLINAVEREQPDVLVFLDRSARPGAHLFRHVWDTLFPERRRPRIRHMNMPQAVSRSYDDEPVAAAVRGARRSLGRGLRGDERIMVVDERIASGETAARANKVISQVFPGATILTPQSNFKDSPEWHYRNRDQRLGVQEGGGPIEEDMVVQPGRPQDRSAFLEHRRRLDILAGFIASHIR